MDAKSPNNEPFEFHQDWAQKYRKQHVSLIWDARIPLPLSWIASQNIVGYPTDVVPRAENRVLTRRLMFWRKRS
jgi:hypothetical protein